MFARRLFSTSIKARANEAVKIQPTLAAKQFVPENATKSKARTLRRKEIRLKKQIIRDVNSFKKHQTRSKQFDVDPVLGHPDNHFMKNIRDELNDQESRLAYGYDKVEFEKLLYGAEKVALDRVGPSLRKTTAEVEEKKRRALLTILNVRNSNPQDKKSMAIELARREFQRHEGDTASSEVQAAILTVKIHFGMEHVKANPKDKDHIQVVRHLVQRRQRILKYLKRDKPSLYYSTIAQLGLTDDAVVREFNMGRQYFEDFKVWGDKKLVKLSEKEQQKANKLKELEKRVAEYHELSKRNHAILQKQNI